MNTLFNHCLKQSQLVQRDLAEFELNVLLLPLLLQGTILLNLASFRKTCAEYSLMVNQQAQPGAMRIASGDTEKQQQRVRRFEQEAVEYGLKFQQLKAQRETILHELGRQELMGRRTHAAAHVAQGPVADGPGDNPYAPRGMQTQREALFAEGSQLSHGSQQLDHILEMGQQALGDLVLQNQTLERVQEKMTGVLVTMGVSRSTIQRVNRRAREDKWIFYGGIILMLVCFWFILKWMR